jgi:group I intron endonuclease
MEVFYLYSITNKIDGKIYIGQSIDPEKRWKKHLAYSKQENKPQYIHRAINKYGAVNFIFEVIASCRTQKDANETEIHLINQYDSRNPDKGYNLCRGGIGGWLGKQHSKESNEKNRQAHLGKKASEETKQKQSASMKEKCANGWMPATSFIKGNDTARVWKGKKLSKEHKNKISEGLKGHTYSEETLNKMRIAQPKKTLSEVQLENVKILLSDGNSLTKIQELTGIERHFISRELKRLGLK